MSHLVAKSHERHVLSHRQAFERQKQIGRGVREARAASQALSRRSAAWAASVRSGEDALRRFGDAAGFLGAAEAELAGLAALLQRIAAAPDPSRAPLAAPDPGQAAPDPAPTLSAPPGAASSV